MEGFECQDKELGVNLVVSGEPMNVFRKTNTIKTVWVGRGKL